MIRLQALQMKLSEPHHGMSMLVPLRHGTRDAAAYKTTHDTTQAGEHHGSDHAYTLWDHVKALGAQHIQLDQFKAGILSCLAPQAASVSLMKAQGLVITAKNSLTAGCRRAACTLLLTATTTAALPQIADSSPIMA